MDKHTWKRYLISSWDTFWTGALMSLAVLVEASNIDLMAMDSKAWKAFAYSALWGAFTAGIRAVLKMFREAFVTWKDKKEV